MKRHDCAREDELLEVLRAGRWPDADDELLRHVAACAVCVDLARVATAFADDRDALMREAEIPGSGLVWWRMQLRLRREADRSARRTLVAIPAFVVTTAIIIAVAILNAAAPGWLHGLAEVLSFDVKVLNIPVIALALITWLALAPVAAYLAMSND